MGYRRSLRPSAMLRRFPIYGPRTSWLRRWFTRSSHEFARRPAPRSRGLRSRMVTHKLMVPYIGFFGSIPRGVAQVLTYSWAFLVVLMWRNSSRGCLARPESAPRSRQGHSPAHTNKSLLAALNLLVALIHLSSGKALCRKPVSEQA